MNTDEVHELIKYSFQQLKKMGMAPPEQNLWDEFKQWSDFHGSRLSTKKAEELRVIYLCGPEPQNDLNVLTSLGLNPHNIWAIESDPKTFNTAASKLESFNPCVNLHRGSVGEFFQKVNEEFDIAYLDGTRPILSTRPRSLNPVIEILSNGRLAPLSVLITNFSEPPEAETNKYAGVMTEYFRYRYNEVPTILHNSGLDPAIAAHDASGYPEFIHSNIGEFYSEFITRLVIDLGHTLIPMTKAMSSSATLGLYTAPIAKRQKILEKALGPTYIQSSSVNSVSDIFSQLGHTQLSPSSYPFLSFLRTLKTSRIDPALYAQLTDWSKGGKKVLENFQFASLLDRVTEGHWEVASLELLRALKTSWFDSKNHFSCDLPLPNLLINSQLGIYGHPHYRSGRTSSRISYTAQKNRMFLDLFVLDRCRSYFDWFPTVTQVPTRFKSIPFQIVARCLMDRIRARDSHSDNHPFRWSAVAPNNELGYLAPIRPLQSRVDL